VLSKGGKPFEAISFLVEISVKFFKIGEVDMVNGTMDKSATENITININSDSEVSMQISPHVLFTAS
jgi:hypothetical protein